MKQQNGEELKNKTFEERYGIEKAKEIKNSMSISLKGKTYIDLHGEEKAHFLSKQNSLSQKLSIDQIQKRYPTFAKEEEMRYNPETPIEEKEIQVHCKNAHCENSKEKGGWFTPTGNQLDGRRRALEDLNGNDGGYIYCSQYCKDTCPLYMSRGTDPYRDMIDNSLDSVEWNLIRQMRFKLDNNECQICGTKENLRCHHIQPVKTYSQLALDVDNCITLCNICHNKVHSGKDKDCSYGNLAKKKCKKQVSKI